MQFGHCSVPEILGLAFTRGVVRTPRMTHYLTNMMMKRVLLAGLFAVCASLVGYGAERTLEKQPGAADNEKGLIGYWKLKGDCRDYSGHGNHGAVSYTHLRAHETPEHLVCR